ncbi:MAG: AraC family transcriptional regulator [Dysgonamonadaceae bacterium]|jgi:AraC-like DNA-binding protein|nr:AraC family transcriptional regulator [Dysgonamonadaceae bacterium]
MSNCKKSADKKFFFLCNDCQAEGKPNIEFLRLTAKRGLNKRSESASLFFLQEGEIDVSYGDVTRAVEKDHFFLIPANEKYSICCAGKTKLVVCSLDEKLLVRHRRKTGLLYDIYNMKLPDFENCELFTVKTNKYIQALLEDCLDVMDGGLTCTKYTQCKTEELLILLRSYYPNESLAYLFQPAFNSKVDFESVVKKNRDKLFTVEEFAAATHLDRNTFRHRFKEIYGVTPTEWIKQERANLVLQELMEGKKTITSIINDYKFSNFPNFIRFCNMHFKNTPGNIRKSLEFMT